MKKNVILCVDDEAIVLMVLKETLLEEFGSEFIIESAESANEALEVISEIEEEGHKIAIIISDWLMPQMNGDEFLIEAHKLYPQAIKILLSGQIDEDALEKTRQKANLHALIQKPWEKKDFLASIYSGIEIFKQN